MLRIMARFGEFVKSTSLVKDPFVVYLEHLVDLELFYEQDAQVKNNLIYPVRKTCLKLSFRYCSKD